MTKVKQKVRWTRTLTVCKSNNPCHLLVSHYICQQIGMNNILRLQAQMAVESNAVSIFAKKFSNSNTTLCILLLSYCKHCHFSRLLSYYSRYFQQSFMCNKCSTGTGTFFSIDFMIQIYNNFLL